MLVRQQRILRRWDMSTMRASPAPFGWKANPGTIQRSAFVGEEPVANATPRDTRAGFDIFRSTGGQIALDELNAQLYEAGYGPVSKRTHRHYRNLIDAGFSRYISINRFDVARAADPYGDPSSNPRYFYEKSDQGVRVVFAKSNKLMETFGRASEVGEVGALLRFEEREVIDGLRKLKPQPGDMVTVRFLELGRSVGGTVVEADVKSEPSVVEIEYGRLITIASLGLGDPLPTAETRFVLSGPAEDVTTLDVTGQRLYHFFELIEGLRSVANEAGAQQDRPTYAAPPDLRLLSVASPAEIVLELAAIVPQLLPSGLLGVLLAMAWNIPAKRKEWLEGDGQREQNKILKVDKELKQLELEQKQQEAAFKAEMLARLRSTFPDSSISDADAARAIEEFVIRPLDALGRTGITDLGTADLEQPAGDGDEPSPA